jgi:hypothetical protein
VNALCVGQWFVMILLNVILHGMRLSMSKVTAKTRSMVYDRDGSRCPSCGFTSPLSIQHRINRGMGGSKLRDNLANLLTMCIGCNTALEADASFRTSGLHMGWKLNSWDDEARVPVYFQYAREWRLLTDDGTYEVIDSDRITRGANGVPLILEGGN